MPITGAIFDFDGTIVDSMPMWERVPMELVARHGKVLTHETFMQIESLSANEKCDWFHEHLGAGESGEALFKEQREMVRHEYETSIQAFPRVHEFLQSLADAGVPMVIASSTPVEDIRLGLRAQGLEHYFQDIIFAADIGRGKEFPDVYLYAQKCLGTPLEATWVFEDAPFGVRTAHEAGFPVVAVLNDHDGRDEAFLRENSDILAHGYEELSLALIEDYAKKPAQGGV